MTFGATFGRTFSPSFNSKSIAAAVAARTNYFNQLYSGTRNNFTGTLGFQFTPTRNITVTAIGRAVSTSIASNHSVGIFSSTGTLLASVTITPTSPVDALNYAYEILGTAITLSSGVSYVIGSSETNGGDKWFDWALATNHLSSADINAGRYSESSFAFPNKSYGGTNYCFVVPTFYE